MDNENEATDTQANEEQPGDNSSSLMMTALGLAALVGIVLGIIGSYFGYSAMKGVAELKKNNSGLDEVKAQVGELKTRLDSVDIGSKTIAAKMQTLSDNTQQAYNNLKEAVEISRKEINELKKLEGSAAVRKAAGGEGRKPAPEGKTAEAPEKGFHIIQEGETFEKLAKQYGTTAEAFLKANPGIEPTKLQIGQKVKIPDKQDK